VYDFEENNLWARPERKRIQQETRFGFKGMPSSRKLRGSMFMDKIFKQWNCFAWNLRQ
jgi:hypothetical protein